MPFLPTWLIPRGGEQKPADEKAMKRMGQVQRLNRTFTFFKMLGFAVVTGAVWQYVELTLLWSLPNGGPAGAVRMFAICCIGLLLNTMCLAEMASMAPSAGGQYHWISEFAPAKHEKLLSYIVGWLTVLGWQVGLASVCNVAALQIQGITIVHYPGLVFKQYQNSLITMAVAATAVFFNTVLVRLLPWVEALMLVLHGIGYFAFLIIFEVMGPKSTASEIFDRYENANQWSSQATATLVGIIAPLTTLISADSVVHLGEEMQDASKNLPRVMVWAAATNFGLGFILVIITLHVAGSIEAAINSPTGQPYIEILLNATNSLAGTTVLVTYIVLALLFCATNVVTTSSRQLWSFARSKAVPFSATIEWVPETLGIPINAVITTILLTFLLSLVLIGSSIAFNIIASLFGISLLASYLVSILTLIYRRLKGDPLPPKVFSLGRFGLPINILTVVFDSFSLVMLCFPAAPNPTAETFNYAPFIFLIVSGLAITYYIVIAKNRYESPAEKIRREGKEDTELEIRRESGEKQAVFTTTTNRVY